MVLARADFTFLTVIQLRHIEIEHLANADNTLINQSQTGEIPLQVAVGDDPPGVMKRLTQR